MAANQNKTKVSGLLIAAGASRRLGQPKQLVNYRGKLLINHVIDELKRSKLDGLNVVLGYNAEEISTCIKSDVEITINDNWEQGMGTSIASGTRGVTNSLDGIMISLVDQYRMDSDLINQLINQFDQDPNKLIVCRYGNDILGPPVIFPKRLIKLLKSLSGDKGAGKIIKSELTHDPEQVVIVDFELGHLDVDTPDDLLKLSK